MDIKKIREIVNSELSDEYTEKMIIDVISKDEKVIPMIMKILEEERLYKNEVYSEMNLLLSKAHLGLENKKYNSDGFMQKEIVEFYTKYKGYVGHCFKNLFGS